MPIKCLWNAFGDMHCKRYKEHFAQLPNDNMQSDNGTRELRPGDSFNSFYQNYMVTYQKDGNLAVYPKVWTTSQESDHHRYMIMNKNGTYTLYNENGDVMSINRKGDLNDKTGTQYEAIYGSALWSSMSPNPNPGRAVIQNDGNFTLRDASDKQYWSTDTYGQGEGPYRMLIQENKDLVLYDKNNKLIWNTKK